MKEWNTFFVNWNTQSYIYITVLDKGDCLTDKKLWSAKRPMDKNYQVNSYWL